ncbi:N-acetyltransferase GCN5 [Raoultella ornithinolytica]|nr:N-acetyltransferase GCN5 [Raoultella ornithinolytica]
MEHPHQAIRNGCRESYAAAVLKAWTPDTMPEGYRHAVRDNPFFVVEEESGRPVATGFLDLRAASVEAIFTLPEWGGKGCAGMILTTIIAEARRRNLPHLTLEATPNAAGVLSAPWFCRRARKAAAVKAGEGGFTLRGNGAPAQLTATARRRATV